MVDGKRFFFCSFCILLQTSSILTFYIQSRAREDYLIGSDIYSDITDDHLHHLVKRDSTGVKCYTSTFGTRVVQKTTVETCVVYCWYERCVAALLKRGNLCKCLPEMSDGAKVDSRQCNIPCAGNKQQNCGGSNAYATYMTGYVHEPFVQRSYRYYPRNVQRDNVGCFIPPRAAPTSLTIKSLRMTYMLCSYLCYQEKHNFAGLFKNDGCYCFFNGKGFKKTSQSKCSVPCAGHDSLKCGGAGEEMNVFRTNGNFEETAGTTTADYELPAWIAPPSQMINGGGKRSKAGGRRSGAGGRRSGANRRNGAGGRRNGVGGQRSGADRRGGAGGRQNPPKIRTRNKGGITSKSKNGIEKGPGKDGQRAKEGGKGERRRKGRGKGSRRRKGRGKGRRRGRGRGRRRRKRKRKKQSNTGNVNGNNRKGNGHTGYRTNVNRHKNRNRFGKTRNGNAQNYGGYGNNGDDYNSEDSGGDYNEENEGRSRNTKGRKGIKEKEKDEAEGGGWLGMLSRGATLNVCLCKHILNMISCYIFIKYIVSL